MSFPAMGAVLSSGLTDPTETHVLLALAYFQNETDGRCFPSTAAIARVSRVSPNFVRKSLKNLEAAGLISSSQRPGCQRSFVLHLDRLPKTEKESESLLVAEPKPLTNPKGVTNSKPLTNSEVHPSRIRKGTPNESERSPLTNSLAEQGIEHGIEQGKEQGIAPLEAETPCVDTNPNAEPIDDVPFPDFEDPTAEELFDAPLVDEAKPMDESQPEAKPKPRNRKASAKKAADWPVEDDGVDAETREAYLAVRKAKRVGPLTTKAYKQISEQAKKYGVSVKVALIKCIERGWVFPYEGAFEEGKNYGKAQQSQQKSAFLRPQSEIDYTYGLDRWNRA